MRPFYMWIIAGVLVLSTSLFANEKKAQSEMNMHTKHMKCMDMKGQKECKEMMMRDCRMNKDECMQMMQEMNMEKGKDSKRLKKR